MKPTKKQIEVLNIIKSHIDIMINTNDIQSPTHWSLIEDVENELDDLVSDKAKEEINEALVLILKVVKNIDHEKQKDINNREFNEQPYVYR